jgi:hypothetical protein
LYPSITTPPGEFIQLEEFALENRPVDTLPVLGVVPYMRIDKHNRLVAL